MTGRTPTLAISTGPMWRLSLEESFAAVAASGADGVEVLVTQSEDTRTVSTLERLAQRHSLPIVAIHAPQLLLTRRVYSTDQVEKVRRTHDLCRALDVSTLVVHPPYLWQVRYSLWVLHELEEAFAGEHTLVAMENMYPIHVGNRRMRFHRFGDVGSLRRFHHVTLDTSHLGVAEHDIVDAYRQLRDRVVHVHLSDNRGKGRDSHAPLGHGVLPIAEFVQGLTGTALRSVCLEIDPGPPTDDPNKIEQRLGESLDIVRRHLPNPVDR